jgi:hypothetical protein
MLGMGQDEVYDEHIHGSAGKNVEVLEHEYEKPVVADRWRVLVDSVSFLTCPTSDQC